MPGTYKKKSDIIDKSILSSHFYTKVSHDKRSSNFMCLLTNGINNVSMGWLVMNIYIYIISRNVIVLVLRNNRLLLEYI